MERIIKGMFAFLSRIILMPFFSREYLAGRWFDNSVYGWRWAWKALFIQRVLRRNAKARWPITGDVYITDPARVHFHPDDLNNFQTFGVYYQCIDADITIGRGTYIAPNVGLITSNHDPADPSRRVPGKSIVLGESCWIGMNAVILPGVALGDHTVVGAGSVVTKSFEAGHCVIAGNPAVVKREVKNE
jgi:hypothetical protein